MRFIKSLYQRKNVFTPKNKKDNNFNKKNKTQGVFGCTMKLKGGGNRVRTIYAEKSTPDLQFTYRSYLAVGMGRRRGGGDRHLSERGEPCG